MSITPNFTPTQVRAALQSSARPFPAVDTSLPTCRAPDNQVQDQCNCTPTTCGAGMLDVDRALMAAAAMPVLPPAPAPEPPPVDAGGGGGGGGALGTGWLLALGLAAWRLRRLNA